jgi:hypothetical protein
MSPWHCGKIGREAPETTRLEAPDRMRLRIEFIDKVRMCRCCCGLLPEILFSISTLLCNISSGNNEQTSEEIEI